MVAWRYPVLIAAAQAIGELIEADSLRQARVLLRHRSRSDQARVAWRYPVLIAAAQAIGELIEADSLRHHGRSV